MKTTRTSNAAFTLIELVVALALLGILCGSIAGVLHNSTASVDQGTAAMDNLVRLRSLQNVLGTALRESVALEVSSTERRMMNQDASYDPSMGRYRFRGEEQDLGFCLFRPLLGTESDGYMHWVLLEIRQDDENDTYSLWLRDVSYLQGVDNPVGQDWGDSGKSADELLPTQEVCLLKGADELLFRYWQLDPGTVTAEPEPEEMESDDIAGDYARRLPDYIELEIRMPKMEEESIYFDYSIRRKGV